MSEIFSNADILMLPSFISTTSDKIDTVPVEDGQIIVLSDKSGYFYDFDGKRRAVGGISFIPDLSDSGQEDILYICTEPAGLYLWNSGEYSSIVHDSNVPDFFPSFNNIGYSLYKTDGSVTQWGMDSTFFLQKNSNGSENSTGIGAAVLALAQITPTVNLRISGDLNANYGPIIIPDLSSSPFEELTLSLDFSDCNIIATSEINSFFNLISIFNSSKIGKVFIKGLTIDHEVAPLGIIDFVCTTPQSKSIYIINSTFYIGRHSTQDTATSLITEGSSGVYPTYNFVNCTFKSNYKEDYSSDFDTANIVTIYPSDTYKSFVFFQNCKFWFLKDGEYAGAMACSYGGYGITNSWRTVNQKFKFSSCVLHNEVMSCQAYFSDINTKTNLQYIFDNSTLTCDNVLYTT